MRLFRKPNEPEARMLLKEWQERLRLQDWIVDVSICRKDEMILAEKAAEIEMNFEQKTAIIRLLDGKDMPQEETILEECHEKTLIHELLHLHFDLVNDALGKNQTVKDVLHQGIELTAQALYNAKYHKKKKCEENEADS